MSDVKVGQGWEIRESKHHYSFYVVDVKENGSVTARCYTILYIDATLDPTYETDTVYIFHIDLFKKTAVLIHDVGSRNQDGCICIGCNELYPYAEPNQNNGKFKCYKCRVGL